MKLHLALLTDEGDLIALDPSPSFELRWSHNYAAYELVQLRWHDDVSYAAWQASDNQAEVES